MAPWNKDPGPLAKGTKESELLKKKVDTLVKESNKVIGNKKMKEKEIKLEQLYQNCLDYRKLVEDQNESMELLKEEDEPNKVKNYDQKKTQELNKLSAMKILLTETLSKLLPDTTEEEFKEKHKQSEDKEEAQAKDEKEKEKAKKATDKPEEEEEEEEDDEEEDEDEEEEDEEEDDEDEYEEEEEEEETNAKPTKIPSIAVKKKDDEEEEETEEEEDDEEYEDEEEEEEEEEEDEEEEEEHEKVDLKKPVSAKRKTEGKASKHKEEEDDDEKDEDEEEDEEDEEDDEEEDEEDEEEEEEDGKKKKGKKEQVKLKKEEKADKKGKKKNVKEEKEEEDMGVTGEQTMNKFEAVDDYDGEEDGDLTFQKGTILTVIETRDDGWWVAENDAGETGLVPSTYLQKFSPPEDDEENDDDEDEDRDDEDEDEDDASPRGKRSSNRSRQLWGSLRTAVTDTTVSDVLHAMGAVPPGFRKSTLSRKFNESDHFRLSNFLIPKLSPSNLMYSDLFFEPSTNKIRLRSTRNDRVITVVSCQQIPPPGAGVEVEGRYVRMCLFDGQQILSNIHSVDVASVDKSQRSWAFSTRLTDNMDPFSHAEVFLRSNNTASNIGILFELCISYSRVSTNEKGEFSCGWVHLPILDINGMAAANKSYDLNVNGGTPYEKGVEVDPAISRRTTNNALASLISGNKQPRLVIKLSQPKQQHKELMDTLPDTIMGSTALLPFYSYYRCCLADTLLRDRLDLDSTELIHNPVLKQFPKVADIPDMMKVFRTSWFEKLKDVRRAEKPSFFVGLNPLRDEEFMKEAFRQVFLESVYPLQHLATLPAYKMGDKDTDQIRQENILRYSETKRGTKSALATLLSPNLVFQPMILEEVAFSVIGPNCLSKIQTMS